MHTVPSALATGAAAVHGVTRDQLRGPRWRSPAHGVHERCEYPLDLRARCLALQLVLADSAVFTHLTAGRLQGLWLPSALPAAWATSVPASLIASVPTSRHTAVSHQDRRGVYVRRCAVPAEHRREVLGVRVASTPWTLVELAEDLTLVDLVVAMDSALQLGRSSRRALESAEVRGRRGARTYRQALMLADGRSESAWETVLRLVHVLGGIVDIEPQHQLRTEDGEPCARGDLWLRGTRRWAEYDGSVHRDPAVHRRDLRRDKLLARIGWERYGYTAPEIHREPHQILADAETALGLPHDPQRVEGWLVEYRRSSLSRPGAARLARRLARFERPAPRRRSARPA